ncbi:hypothetical protein [Lysinibacillus sp. 3P01SB]|uniref:hypothetical protein n=1 Tax=Lysinibacillus sp. 3P01SB TaxID=3132284 RepID=UPI0039A7537C
MNRLTSTSFNPIQPQQQTLQTNQALTLREGQVFHGTIKQLYPDQMAEIQVGGHKLIAKLEVPLTAGDAHFFQVASTGAQTELKVVTGPMPQAMGTQQQMAQLLQSMNLPQTKEMQQVMGHFLKTQMPITREQLLQAEAWMKALPQGVTKQDALSAMQRMVELKMPFTNDVFQALVQGAKTTGMNTALQNFISQLTNETNLNTELKTSLLTQLQTIAKPLDNETGGVILARAVQTLTDTSASATNRQQALMLLKEAGVIPQTASMTNWQSQLAQTTSPSLSLQPGQAGQLIGQIMTAKPEDSTQIIQQVRNFLQNEKLLTAEQKNQLNQMVERFTQLPQTKQTIEVFARQLQDQLLKAFSMNNDNRLFTQNDSGLTVKNQLLSLLKPDATHDTVMRNLVRSSAESSQPAIQSLLTEAEAIVRNAVDGRMAEQAIKTVLKGLGISYEAALNSKASDVHSLAQSVKPQLLSLLQDAQLPPALRESAELLMARMNGMQLLSGENGHQHQLIMQLPLEFFGRQMDATLQWNGRMGKDGKIDANFARILFYLNMESLHETVIDMQVQNRVVTITVFNDDPQLSMLAEPLKQSLKGGLSDKEYQLSGVFIKSLERKDPEKATQNSKKTTEQWNGVDIRV